MQDWINQGNLLGVSVHIKDISPKASSIQHRQYNVVVEKENLLRNGNVECVSWFWRGSGKEGWSEYRSSHNSSTHFPNPVSLNRLSSWSLWSLVLFVTKKTLASKNNCFPFVYHVPVDLKRFLGRIGGKMEILWKNGGGWRFEAASPLKSDHLIRFPKPTMARLTNLGKSQTLFPSTSSSFVLNASACVAENLLR